MFKKIIALLLALLCIISCFASCTDEEASESSSDPAASESSSDTAQQGAGTGIKYDPNTSILLSGESRYRIVYASGISKSIALKVYDKLSNIDPVATQKVGYYTLTTDKKATDNNTPEILIGLTNRAISTQAKNALEDPLDFSIVISGNKIAIYANTEARLIDAVNYFNSKVALTDNYEVIYTSKDNYVEKYTPEKTLDIKVGGVAVDKFTIIVPTENNEVELAVAEDLAAWLISQTGKYIVVDIDIADETANEILIGKTNRAQSKALTSTSLESTEFATSFDNGKLAIFAGSRTGYNMALSSMKNAIKKDGGSLEDAFTVRRLTFEEIKSISVGAVRYEVLGNALYFHKSTEDQITAWHNYDSKLEGNAKATTGVRLDFETDSSSFYFETTTTSVTFELYINGEKAHTLTGQRSHFIEIDTSSKETNRITLIFPSNNDPGNISCVQLDGGSTFTRHQFDKKILFIGDSITQGYNTSIDSLSYAHIVSRHFNADSVIQGVGGARFSHLNALSAIPYDPDVVIVALGCNDWSNSSNATTYRSSVSAYLSRIKTLYEGKTVIVISPIPRLDEVPSATLPLASARNIIAEEAASRGFFHVNGGTLVPANATYYANDVYHPNTKGFEEYAKNLIPAIQTYVDEA